LPPVVNEGYGWRAEECADEPPAPDRMHHEAAQTRPSAWRPVGRQAAA